MKDMHYLSIILAAVWVASAAACFATKNDEPMEAACVGTLFLALAWVITTAIKS